MSDIREVVRWVVFGVAFGLALSQVYAPQSARRYVAAGTVACIAIHVLVPRRREGR